MTTSQLIAKFLVKVYLENFQNADFHKISCLINDIKGIDRVFILRNILEELAENDKLDNHFLQIVEYFPVTGTEFISLKENFNQLFVRHLDNHHNEINVKAFQFNTFTEKQMETFLETASRKDKNHKNLYEFNDSSFLKFITLEQYKKYFYQLKFQNYIAQQSFPHHTRETILKFLEVSTFYQILVNSIWIIETGLLTEEDMEPYIKSFGIFYSRLSAKITAHYSRKFWTKMFEASLIE